jgi:hypothetical protein
MYNITNYLTNDSVRYEKKYLTSAENENKLSFCLQLHPLLFTQLYSERQVNNIYLDTHSMSNYYDNVAGISKRTKVRIRWYGDRFGIARAPVLEIKVRDNTLGSKYSFVLDDILIDSSLNIDTIRNKFKNIGLPVPVCEYLCSLKLTLMNSYVRNYFISSDSLFRITIDRSLEFISIGDFSNTFMHKVESRRRRILEVKYAECLERDPGVFVDAFPFRITKSSKYVYGIDKLKVS